MEPKDSLPHSEGPVAESRQVVALELGRWARC